MGQDSVRSVPARWRLWPAPSSLFVSAVDEDEMKAFAKAAGLSEASAQSLVHKGISVALLAELPLAQCMRLARRAALPTAARLHLRHAIRCHLGVPLPRLVTEEGPRVGSREPLERAALRRIFYLPQPTLMVVQLSPALAVRARPELRGQIVAYRQAGEVLSIIAQCGGWRMLQPTGGQRGSR